MNPAFTVSIALVALIGPGFGFSAAADETSPATRPDQQSADSAVTSKTITVADRKYAVYEYTDPESNTYCVVIPEGLTIVRGLLVNSNYYAGDSRGDWTFCHYYREFMHLHDFALVAANGTCPHAAAFKGLHKSLQKISVDSNHPELVNAPYAAPSLEPGADVTITVDPSKSLNWKTMICYDGARKLGEITKESGPLQFTATRLSPGYHVFSVLATDGNGNVHTSDPRVVVVRYVDNSQ